MANNTNKPATPAANISGPANVASLPAIAGATYGPPRKYGAAAATVPCAANAYRLTNLGNGVAANGAGKGGKPTVMGLVAVAAKAAGATPAKAVSGLAIVQAMQTNKAVVAAYALTKAGMYAPKGALPCPAWCSGYVVGAARAAAGLLAKVANA